MKLNNYWNGKIAEYIVMIIYSLKLYKILSYRMRNFGGEIDIIAKRGNNLVFIEVKSRKNDLSYYGADILTSNQKQRIIRSAKIFITKYKFFDYNVRFDLVILKKLIFPTIIENAWSIE